MARLAREPDTSVVVIDNMLTGRRANLMPESAENVRFVKADVNSLSDMVAVMSLDQFDYVFHYAAVVGVERTLANPVLVLRDIDGIRNVLDLSKNTGVRRVFYSSSSEVYGEPVEFPQHEVTTPLNSRLPYAIVKNVGEAFFRSYQQEYGLDYTVFRFFNTYGPRQSSDFVMSKFVRAALDGRDLTVYGAGNQTRTFCYIDDNTEATIAAMRSDEFVNDVINIGSDEEVTILELARLVIDVTGSSSEIRHLPPLPEGDMTRRKPDISRMRSLISRDLTPIRAGIERVAESMASTSALLATP